MDDETELKVADILYRSFDMSFSRPWDDLPLEVQDHWRTSVRELVIELRDANLIIKKMGER